MWACIPYRGVEQLGITVTVTACQNVSTCPSLQLLQPQQRYVAVGLHSSAFQDLILIFKLIVFVLILESLWSPGLFCERKCSPYSRGKLYIVSVVFKNVISVSLLGFSNGWCSCDSGQGSCGNNWWAGTVLAAECHHWYLHTQGD